MNLEISLLRCQILTPRLYQVVSTDILPPPPQLPSNESRPPASSASVRVIIYCYSPADLAAAVLRTGTHPVRSPFASQALRPGCIASFTPTGFGRLRQQALPLHPRRYVLLDAVTVQSTSRGRSRTVTTLMQPALPGGGGPGSLPCFRFSPRYGVFTN